VTCVVGIRGEHGVLLAADSQSSGENLKRMDTDSKVFQLSEIMAVAYCGSGRFGQILKHWLMDALDEPPLDRDLRRWYVREFAPVLRDVLNDHGHLHILEADQTEYLGNSAFLLAVRDRVFAIEPDFSINENELPFEAMGSGGEAAMGALRAEVERHDRAEAEWLSGSWSALERIARRAIVGASETTLAVGGTIRLARTSIYTADEKAQARRIVKGCSTPRDDEGWYVAA
jgi:20S proteasome alpha/beta subunit